jgi:CHAT domain-containing protein
MTRHTDKKTALLVSMPETPDQVPLLFVQDEMSAVTKLLAAPGVKSVVHATPPLKKEILNLLSRCNIVHFACHGESTADPSQSCLLLDDWKADRLTVKDITAKKVQNAELAYLSACHSVRSRALPLLDEGIHLAGSFLLAGFPHVVGTLWQINDKRSVAVAEAVYSYMIRNDGGIDFDASAEAVHRATRILRDETTRLEGTKRLFPPDPFLWAPYVHLGAGRKHQVAAT